jgi:hypothetical protein
MEGSFRSISHKIHGNTQGEDLCKVLRISLGSTLCLSKSGRSDRREGRHPYLGTSWTHPQEAREDFLQRIDLAINEKKQQLIFSQHQMGFAPAPLPSRARLLTDIMPIERVLPRLCKVDQQSFKLFGVSTGQGAQHPRVQFEIVVGEHRCRLFSRVLDFDSAVCSP